MLRLLLFIVFRLFELAVFAYCIMSWFVRPGTQLYDIYVKMAYYLEPIFKPFRNLLARLNLNIPIDFSPWLALIAASLLYRVLAMLL